MSKHTIPGGIAHTMPDDLANVMSKSSEAIHLWNVLTPIARNEFICWVENAKQIQTRKRRITRTIQELVDGNKRPCCWVGCIHRQDKAPSKWQQAILLSNKSTTTDS